MSGRQRHWMLAPAVVFLIALPRGAACAGGRDGQPGGAATRAASATRPGARPLAPRGDDVESRRLSRSQGDAADGWMRTLLALGIVIALIFAARYALRRFGGRGSGVSLGRRGAVIEVLTRTSFSPRQQLALVRLGRRLVLVGSGPEGMTALAEVTDRAEADELLARLGAGGADTDSADRGEGGAS